MGFQLLFFLVFLSDYHPDQPFEVTAQAVFSGEGLSLPTLWKYQGGENPQGADPQLDHGSWPVMKATLRPDEREPWVGSGWFRMNLKVDESLWGQTVGLKMRQRGASEIWLNGKKCASFGNPLETKRSHSGRWPATLTFASQPDQVLAVHYTTPSFPSYFGDYAVIGFRLQLQSFSTMTREFFWFHSVKAGRFKIFGAIFGIIALFHLILFYFNRKEKTNLYFGLFTLVLSGFITLWINVIFGITTESYFLGLYSENLAGALILMLLLAFAYELFQQKTLRLYWFLMAAAPLCFLISLKWNPATWISLILLSGEIIRQVFLAWRHRRRGAKTVGLGILFLIITLLLPFNQALIVYLTEHLVLPLPFWGALILVLTMSVFLSREVALTSKNLEGQLVEVKKLGSELVEKERVEKEREIERRLLEADHARKTQELEEARHFQLSMLPKSLPQLPHLACAAAMETATEVGGDYYDYFVDDQGLTIAVGDATGHGTRAGTMVAAVKSLFSLLGNQEDLRQFFHEANRALKKMSMRKMFMALTLVRLRQNRMTISAAGMPPAYIHRAQTNDIEEVLIKGLPLGGIPFPYAVKEFQLHPGDTVLLMSDGLPELFNQDEEMLDFERTKALFKKAAHQEPEAIIADLLEGARSWRGTRAQDDDMTFFVFKIKDSA